MTKFFGKKISSEYKVEFESTLYQNNLEKTFLMCFVAMIFALLLLPLEWSRFQDGSLQAKKEHMWFLYLHCSFLLLLIPLFASKRTIRNLQNNVKIKPFPTIAIAIILLSSILLSIDYLALHNRKSTAAYPIFILFINLVLMMSHRNRCIFNFFSIVAITYLITITCSEHGLVGYIIFLQSLAVTMTAFFVGVHQLNASIRQFTSEQLLIAQQQKSDELLLNILPESIVAELKKNGNIQAQTFENVTIMFCDFINFSKICQLYPAEILVETLNYYFKAFDQILDNYPIEKIKTIGDAYLCISGLPTANVNHATDTLQAAIEIRTFILTEAEKRKKSGDLYFNIRIGVHSGKAVAGIVGTKKFAYDIWGDTVNISARLQNAAAENNILFSENTAFLLKDSLLTQFKGNMELKNVGKIGVFETR